MSVDSAVFWSFVVAWAIVLGGLLFVAVPSIAREVQRIVRHIVRLIEDSPIPPRLAEAEAGIDRIGIAVDEFPRLLGRAIDAWTLLRSLPAVPPDLSAAVERARAEVGAFSRNANPTPRR